MGFFAIVVAIEGQAPRASVVEADRIERQAEAALFYAGDRLVYRVPAAYLLSAEACATGRGATEKVEAFRDRRHGASTIHVEERSAPAPRRRGGPSGGIFESLSVKIRE